MTDPASPIVEDFPADFKVDMGGKNWEWEAVVLIPFMDEAALMKATASIDQNALNEQERHRNQLGDSVIFQHATMGAGVEAPSAPVLQSVFYFPEFPADQPYFLPVLCPGVKLGPAAPPGFPTLFSLPLELGRLDTAGVDVFGRPSRRESMCLTLAERRPEPGSKRSSALDRAEAMVGTVIHIQWPYWVPAICVTASNATAIAEDVAAWRRVALV